MYKKNIDPNATLVSVSQVRHRVRALHFLPLRKISQGLKV